MAHPNLGSVSEVGLMLFSVLFLLWQLNRTTSRYAPDSTVLMKLLKVSTTMYDGRANVVLCVVLASHLAACCGLTAVSRGAAQNV